MKKLGKLSINPDKIIKNEELVNLRGGYGNYVVSCKDSEGNHLCGTWLGLCMDATAFCSYHCPDSTASVCA